MPRIKEDFNLLLYSEMPLRVPEGKKIQTKST